jgi:hypothetical protein
MDTIPSNIENSKCLANELNLDFSQALVDPYNEQFKGTFQSKSENFGFNVQGDQTEDIIDNNFNYGTPGTSPRGYEQH